jgi:hypothetical protein
LLPYQIRSSVSPRQEQLFDDFISARQVAQSAVAELFLLEEIEAFGGRRIHGDRRLKCSSRVVEQADFALREGYADVGTRRC